MYYFKPTKGIVKARNTLFNVSLGGFLILFFLIILLMAALGL